VKQCEWNGRFTSINGLKHRIYGKGNMTHENVKYFNRQGRDAVQIMAIKIEY
jgi:hypothetical protein